jgi:hypothetical protein
MKVSVKKRIEEAEKVSKEKILPYVILINFNHETGQWEAQENYITGSKIIPLENKNAYKAPEGYTGVIFKGAEELID